jgi:predicted nucleotidyltransferase
MINKKQLKNEIVNSLKGQKEIEKIIIFGSFNRIDSPNDLDIAVVQNSSENYLPLALKYRRLIRNVTKQIAVDIFPVVGKNENSFFKNEVLSGEVIYARGS